MKKTYLMIMVLAFFAVGMGGCIKNDPVIFTDRQVEIDATALNSNAAGLTYPILGRIPAYGRVTSNTSTIDSTLRRQSGTIRIRLNLIGPQLSKAETVSYTIFSSPITSFSMGATITGQSPATAAGTLAVTDAVAGTHFTGLSGSVSFPPNSSFAYIDIPILNAPATAGAGRFLGIRLTNSGTIPPAVNYSELGLVIDQR